jgi:predicted GNAT family acetyltransferase
MTIENFDDGKKGYYRALENETEAGRMTYTWAGETKIIIDHTEVNPAFRGKDIGLKLLMEVVHFARAKNIKILPLCPFTKAMFDKMKEIGDVLF